MSSATPPRLAEMVLETLLPSDEHDALIGDLHEEYALRASVSGAAASRWYWSQVLRSSPSIVWRQCRHGRWISNVAIGIAAYIVVGALNAAGAWLIARWAGEALMTNYATTAAVALTAIAAGAHLASRIRPSAGHIVGCLAAIVAVLMLVFPVDASPAWYQMAFVVLGPSAAYLGTFRGTPRATPGDHRL